METLIFGPGALGCALARHLQNHQKVRIFGPRAPRGAEFVPLWQPVEPEVLESPAFLWLSCKASQVGEALEPLRALVSRSSREVIERSLLIAPQNGIGITALIEESSLGIPLCRAVAWFGARWEGGRLLETPPPRRITLGATEPAPLPSLRRVLTASGFVVDELDGPQAGLLVEWKKGLTSVALNPVLALARKPNGALPEDEALQARARELQTEALAVFNGLGLRGISENEAWSDLLRTCRETATNRNSMLQDLEAGRPLELQWLNEKLLEQGARLGLELRAHRRIIAELKSRA